MSECVKCLTLKSTTNQNRLHLLYLNTRGIKWVWMKMKVTDVALLGLFCCSAYFYCALSQRARLKGSYDAILKIIILCIWRNRICWHALMFKKHIIFSDTVHYCSSSMPRLSQTHRFLQSPTFRQAQSALIGQLTQCIVIGRTSSAHRKCNAPYHNRASAFKVTIKTVNNVVSFTISSSPKGEQSHVTVMMLVCICST